MNSTFTHDEIVLLVVIGLITLVLYLLRNTPLGFLWKIYKWFWAILFVTLFANYAKKEIKEWWEK
jgi:energy-coupling factor transporter transmembrane protein EcfT